MQPTVAPWSKSAPVPSTQSKGKEFILAATINVGDGKMPETLPIDSMQWKPAEKCIKSQEVLERVLTSDSMLDYVQFIQYLNKKVKGCAVSKAPEPSCSIQKTLDILDRVGELVNEIPPQQHKVRYGNPAYRQWFDQLDSQTDDMLKTLLDEKYHKAIPELRSYFMDSFGNKARIDYGTGHETNFVAFLYCLARLGVYEQTDAINLVLLVFKKYVDVMRIVQTTYWLEPAGSHGVWGLDDYQFLVFVWGAAQLSHHSHIQPKHIHNIDIMDMYAKDYMYLDAVNFVKQVKKGPLQETSPFINDISQLPTWDKVNNGMMKMYHGEVLSKLPIMQHFLFGNLIQFQGKEAE